MGAIAPPEAASDLLSSGPVIEHLKAIGNHRRHSFAPYHLKATTARGNRVVSGRDSLMLFEGCIADFDGPQAEYRGVTNLHYGSFCQQAGGLQIFLGGEHRNDEVLNHSLSHFEELKFHVAADNKQKLASYAKGPTTIGNNVIISRNATLLSGICIGDGAVVAANSVATRDVPPFAIVAGNPAQVIKHRFSEAIIESLLAIRWWDFDYVFLCHQIDFLVTAPVEAILEKYADVSNNVYEKPGDCILLRTGLDPNGEHTIVVEGVESNGSTYTADALPPEIVSYLSQTDPQDVTVDHDIFRFLPNRS